MALRWKLDDEVLRESVFKSGKLLTLEGFDVTPPPRNVEVFRSERRSGIKACHTHLPIQAPQAAISLADCSSLNWSMGVAGPL